MKYAFLTPGEYRRLYGNMLWRYRQRAERMKRENYKRWARFVVL